MRIFADSSSFPSLPLGVRVQVSIFRAAKYDFPLNSFQCDGACWLAVAWVVPAHKVVRDTSVLCLNCVRPPANTLGTSSQAHLLVMSLTEQEKRLNLHFYTREV